MWPFGRQFVAIAAMLNPSDASDAVMAEVLFFSFLIVD